MTDRKQALTDLLAKVEAGTIKKSDFWPSRGAPDGLAGKYSKAYYAFRGSLDAAMALHEAVLVGWFWMVMPRMKVSYGPPESDCWIARVWASGEGATAVANDPARALLIADLKALIAQEGDQ